jgi:hypothetical protein
MDSTEACDEIRPLLAELALGAAAGHERARVVWHVASCLACSRELEHLTTVADGLLLLAPATEPPAGFEPAVLARTRTTAPSDNLAPRTRRPRRIIALAAGVLAAVLAGGVGGVAVGRDQLADDRAQADHYRQVLATANGRYLRTVPLTTGSGTAAGAVFLYEGNPSWMLVVVADAPRNGAYDMTVTYTGGGARRAGTCQVAAGTGTTAYQLSTPVADIAAVSLTGPDGATLSTAGR